MRDLFQKFIIEGGNLIIGKVSFHRDLVCTEEDVKGGGWFSFDYKLNAFLFCGESDEFGEANFYDIRKAVLRHRVYLVYDIDDNISEKHDFYYRKRGSSKLFNLKTTAMEIFVMQTQSGDWEGLYVDGRLVDEGEILGEGLSRLYLLQKAEEFEFTSEDVKFFELSKKDSEYALELGSLPDKKSDLFEVYK